MSKYKDFFKEHGDYMVRVDFYENSGAFSVEELYQAIKERISAEVIIKIRDYGVDG